MGKIFDIKKAYETSSTKLPNLKKNSGLTDEQIDILYAVASSAGSFHFDADSLIADKIYSVKIDAIKNLLKLFNYDGEIKDVENLLMSIRSVEIYKQFAVYDDDDEVNFYVFSDVYVGETADCDIARIRTRFIFSDDGEIWKMDENIARLGYEKYDIEVAKKDFKELADFLNELDE